LNPETTAVVEPMMLAAGITTDGTVAMITVVAMEAGVVTVEAGVVTVVAVEEENDVTVDRIPPKWFPRLEWNGLDWN